MKTDKQKIKWHVSRQVAAGIGVIPNCMHSINDIMHL